MNISPKSAKLITALLVLVLLIMMVVTCHTTETANLNNFIDNYSVLNSQYLSELWCLDPKVRDHIIYLTPPPNQDIVWRLSSYSSFYF